MRRHCEIHQSNVHFWKANSPRIVEIYKQCKFCNIKVVETKLSCTGYQPIVGPLLFVYDVVCVCFFVSFVYSLGRAK